MRYFLKELLEPIAYLIYCIILLATYRVKKTLPYKSLAFYYAFATLLLFLANAENNAGILSDWNYNVMFLVNICVLSYYYYGLCTARHQRQFILNSCGANVLVFIYFDIINGQFQSYNNYVYAFAFICVIVYSLFYYRNVLHQVSEENILHKFDFWLVSANFVYFLGAFIIVLIYNDTELSIHGDLWGIQSIVLFISSLIALMGYLAIIRKKE